MDVLIKGAKLIDGTGDSPSLNSFVLVRDKKIIDIGSQKKLPKHLEKFRVLDFPNGTILPGLIETHSHMHCTGNKESLERMLLDSEETLIMRSVKAMRESLLSGVTTMRDLGSRNRVAFSIKEAIVNGIIDGPRILVAGTPITTTAGHCYFFGTEANSQEEILHAVRRQVKLGADCIKIMSTGGNLTPRSNPRRAQFSLQLLQDAVDDAHRLEVPVASHCHGTEGIVNSVNAGVDNLIHCSWISSNPSEGYDYREDVVDEIADKGIFVDPTIALGHLRQIDDPEADVFQPGGVFYDLDARYEMLRDMWEKGVRFISGLDAGMYMGEFGTHYNSVLVMIEKMGVSPIDAIKCVTKNSAECLGILQETGTLEKGKSADLIVLSDDFEKNPDSLQKVDTVINKGEIVKENQIPLI